MKYTQPRVIGSATLYLGDCLEVLPTLGCVDAVVTDPPYGISDAPLKPGRKGAALNDWHAESWWDKAINPAWCEAVCGAAPLVAWFGQWRKREQVEKAMKFPLRAEIVWAKDCHSAPPCPVAPRDERIWIFSERGVKGATFETSVWDQAVIPTWSQKEHKNEKPVALMRRLIAWTGAKSVIDPFMGSGTTGVACMDLGLPFVGIELDPAHFETACRRIEDAQRQGRLIA
jgi:site-specific DNA-methyltransferase (adenine-specific)